MRRTFDWAPDYWRSTWRNWWMVARGGCCWWGRAERDGGRVIGQMRSSRSWRPVRMESIVLAGSLPMRSVSSVLSMVRFWDTLMTLALGRLAAPFSSGTLPGARARVRLEVIRQTTVVARRLRLKTSLWTTTQGCRAAGAELSAGPKSSQ